MKKLFSLLFLLAACTSAFSQSQYYPSTTSADSIIMPVNVSNTVRKVFAIDLLKNSSVIIGINASIAGKQAALGFTPYNATNPSGYINSSALAPYLLSSTAASTYLTPTGSAASLTGFPTLNQNTTGTAAGLSANIAESQVTNLTTDLAAKAPVASPTFTGTPAAPTATAGTNTTQIATTAFVTSATGGTTVTGEENTGSTASTITLAHSAIAGTLQLYKNGVRLWYDRFSLSGTTLTLTDTRLTTDQFIIDYKY